MLRITNGMTRLDTLQPYTGNDVARLGTANFITVISMHLNHSANTLCLARKGIQNRVTLFQHTRIDAYKGQCTKTVIHDFECQRSEWFLDRYRGNFTRGLTKFISQFLRLNLGWGRQIINNGIKYQLHTLVLERRTTVSREEIKISCPFSDTSLNILDRDLFSFEVHHRQVVVLLHRSFE